MPHLQSITIGKVIEALALQTFPGVRPIFDGLYSLFSVSVQDISFYFVPCEDDASATFYSWDPRGRNTLVSTTQTIFNPNKNIGFSWGHLARGPFNYGRDKDVSLATSDGIASVITVTVSYSMTGTLNPPRSLRE
jgi:hypothetical protein